ncbi:type I pullulanase [Paraclostridium bifermentans]|uniref:type I pullulanase n=1 Tax=Paraclostridium bifermentans TaxID=1490 RepID=UPI002431E205|nr:type I pullulanase [Paraclostridium bifermentans]
MYRSLINDCIYNDNKIYAAIMDNENDIKLYLDENVSSIADYDLFIDGKIVKNTSKIILEKQRQLLIKNLPDIIKPTSLLEIRRKGCTNGFKVFMRDYLNKFKYNEDDLGVKFLKNTISLKLWAPTAYKVQLLLYRNCFQKEDEPSKVFNMKLDDVTGVHSVNIDKLTSKNKYYLYRLYFKDIDKNNVVTTLLNYAIDPYAIAACVNGDKGFLIDINDVSIQPLNWTNDEKPPLKSIEECILYELHIRDFTIDKSSGVSENLRGKFLGAVEENTVNKNNGIIVKTGLSHLKELGITHVHLMPSFDFATVDEKIENENNRNWGYDPKNFNIPEGSYSTNPFNPKTRIKEFKTMILRFHKNNIRIVMDMVYNHMYKKDNLNKIVPGYYFRTNSIGKFTNGSGCGNELATERPMVRKLILDSVLHWIKNYHIDGLRFDLMELIDLETMKEITKKVTEIDNTLIVYGEPWKAEWSPLVTGTYKGCQRGNNFSIFNDTFRDAIRGNNMPSWGFVNGDQHNMNKSWDVVEGIKGSINGLTTNPRESINYVEAHDNYTLWDQIEKSLNFSLAEKQFRRYIPNDPFDNYNVRQCILAIGIILTSQGIPFLHEGFEILRTKQGDHNSYKSPDSVNSIKWNDKIQFNAVYNYFKGLIKLRKEHPAFRMRTALEIRANQHVYFPQNNDRSGVIISHIRNHANGDLWNNILIIYNSTTIDNYDVNSSTPLAYNGFWNIVVNDKIAGTDIIEVVENGKIPKIRSHSMMVLYE